MHGHLSATAKPEQQKTTQRTQLIQVDKKYSLMNKVCKKKVEQMLQGQLDYLLGRKEIDKMRKRKVQEMEEEYEKQRSSRISKMDQKISRSDKNRAQTIKDRQSKSRKNLEFFDEKIKKIGKSHEKELQKMLGMQRDYLIRRSQSRSSLKSLNNSRSNLKSSRSFNQSLLKTELEKSLKTIDTRIELIQSRIDQAKTNQQFYQRQKSEKAKLYSKDMHETLSKIQAKDHLEETKCIQDYHKRITHIISCQERAKSLIQNESERRRKNIDEKFKKCNENLKYLSKAREEKLQKLQLKFDKEALPKTWRDERSEVYLSKFFENHRSIQQEKLLKSECIMSKHLNLSLKNRALREKKDRIFQTVRRVEI